MIFRRPELEKDNPIAPEPYVGPRRRLAMARATALEDSNGIEEMKEALQALVDAATRFQSGLPKVKEPGKGRKALREAIAQARRVLAVEERVRRSRTSS